MSLTVEMSDEAELDEFRAGLLWEVAQLLDQSFCESERILAVADRCYNEGGRLHALTREPYGGLLLACEMGAIAREGEGILHAYRERANATIH